METLHGLDERQTEAYIEMLGRVSALNLAYFDDVGELKELSHEMVDLSKTPVIPNAKDTLGNLSADVLTAYSIFRKKGVDAAGEYLIGVARKV
jgi:hypothetical protein